MAVNIVRYRLNEQTHWGLLEGSDVFPLDIPCTTTRDLLALDHDQIRNSKTAPAKAMHLKDVELLSPITTPTRVLCQGANYRQHMIDSGMDPEATKFNMFFTKSSASVTGPTGKIIKPEHVTLLDYEVELALVIGKQTQGAVTVNNGNLHEYVAGICIGNDISARDVQIPQMQFHKGKSYRTFCPLGPVLCLLEKEEMHYLDKLDLELCVNGTVRQKDNTANLVFKPAETLQEYSQIHDFEPGDVLMTGTPSGCALGLPKPFLVRLIGLLPEDRKWQLFLKAQRRRTEYLKVSDRIEATIVSRDGKISLGKQSHLVAEE